MALEYQRGSVYIQGKRRKMWYGKYRVWGVDPFTKNPVTKQRNRKIGPKADLTRFEAEEKLRQMIASENAHACMTPVDSSPEKVTLEWFVVNRYLPMMSCRETTKRKTAYEIKRYILEAFGQTSIKDINLFLLQTQLNKLAKNFSNSIVRHAYVNLRSIFNTAVDLDFVAKSPARRLRMPDTRAPDRTVASPAVIMRMLNAIEDPRDKCLFAIAVFCALRTAEVFGLTWGCCQRKFMAIKNTAFEGHIQENKVKTIESRALVPIPDLIQPIIEKWQSRCENTNPEALMFPTTGKGSRNGQAVPFDSTNFMERRIYPVADRLGIPRRLVRFQVMRRTVGTDLQAHGTLKDAQAALRHKNASTTADVYMQPVSQSVIAALNSRTAEVFRTSATADPSLGNNPLKTSTA